MDRKEAINAWNARWIAHAGEVPPSALVLQQRMEDMNPVMVEASCLLREWIYEERPDGLSTAMKELIYVVLDVALGNETGGIAHAKKGIGSGLTLTQLSEALTQCYNALGMPGFGSGGHGNAIWAASKEFAQSRTADQADQADQAE